jgi:hypothetical protein
MLEVLIMHGRLKFSLEVVDGDRLGKLAIPFSQVANWLNLLTSPHYDIQIVHTEQAQDGVTIYFDACEVMYWYIGDRANCEHSFQERSRLPLAS